MEEQSQSTFVLIQHNAHFPLPLMSGSSLYPSYQVLCPAIQSPTTCLFYPCKTKQKRKKISLLICSLCRSHLSHTNLTSLLQEFKWQRNKYPWNIQVKWAARTKTVWQLHAGQLYRCHPDCCAMIFFHLTDPSGLKYVVKSKQGRVKYFK